MANFATADLCDEYDDSARVAEPIFRDFGGREAYCGAIRTVKLFEDNSLVREALEEAASGDVLIVDGGGSTRCALVGDQLAELGVKNGWSGVIVFGAIRDSAVIRRIDLGMKAVGTCPRKSVKRGIGERDVPVRFAGVEFRVGEYVYADADGVIVAASRLTTT